MNNNQKNFTQIQKCFTPTHFYSQQQNFSWLSVQDSQIAKPGSAEPSVGLETSSDLLSMLVDNAQARLVGDGAVKDRL